MAKHGTITLDEAGVPTFVESAGVVAYVTDALSTVLSSQKVAVGHAATVQKVALVVAGNAAGIHSATGKVGVGVLGKNIYMGK